MLHILSSTARQPSDAFREAPRLPRENNVQWVERHLDDRDAVHLLLLGGRDPIAFRLRVAQSHVRDDLSPSHWSHVALLGPAETDAGPPPRVVRLSDTSYELLGRGGFRVTVARLLHAPRHG